MRRLRERVRAILLHAWRPIDDILDETDAQKYRSSLTLFQRSGGEAGLFEASLRTFYRGRPCERTLQMLSGSDTADA